MCCRQCAKEALKDLCHWLHHGGEVAVCLTLFITVNTVVENCTLFRLHCPSHSSQQRDRRLSQNFANI